MAFGCSGAEKLDMTTPFAVKWPVEHEFVPRGSAMMNCQSMPELRAIADISRCDTSLALEPTWNKRCRELLKWAQTCSNCLAVSNLARGIISLVADECAGKFKSCQPDGYEALSEGTL